MTEAVRSGLVVRAPHHDEVPRIWELVRELAVYERLEHELVGSAERLAEHLFASPPLLEARVAERGERIVGYALFYALYSSFHTQPWTWLEDLHVEPAERGRGTGRALIAAVARAALDRGHGRLGWFVLDWNAPSIAFYQRLGATPTAETWLQYGLEGDALRAVGESSPDA